MQTGGCKKNMTMKKYILKLIEEELYKQNGFILGATKRIESGKYDIESNREYIEKAKKRIAFIVKQRELFLKKMK
jgi:hypothetical protein